MHAEKSAVSSLRGVDFYLAYNARVLCFSGRSFVRKSFRYASEPAYKLDVSMPVIVYVGKYLLLRQETRRLETSHTHAKVYFAGTGGKFS